MGNCAGLDWASAKHDVLIQDPAGRQLSVGTFAHDEPGISALCKTLTGHDVEVIAIERPDGLLVERLLETGIKVLALHPNQVKAARDRFRASGGKSDRFDAFVFCELARTDAHRFRVLEPGSDRTKAIQALIRTRQDLVAARVVMGHQLRAELDRFWPGPTRMFQKLDSRISLAFLTRYPSPEDARLLGEKRLTAFLKAHRYPKPKAAGELLERLRSAPSGRAGEIETRTRRQIVLTLTSTLQVIGDQIRGLEAEITEQLESHPDAEIFRSLFRTRSSVVCAATMLAEIGDCRARYPHRDSIGSDGGQAPVAVESGKFRNATFRWACNKSLRGALRTLAHNSRQWNLWSADLYLQARQRGHDHERALRTVGRAWSRIIWRCWQNHTAYDPTRHSKLQQHITVTIPSPTAPRPDVPASQRMAGINLTPWANRTPSPDPLVASVQEVGLT
jgi:transposase